MKKSIFLTSIILQTVLLSTAQINKAIDKNLIYKKAQQEDADTISFLNAFKKGQFSGHLRYFFMNTLNEKNLTDYFSNAFGAGLRFETAKFHNFQSAISGFSIYNIGSSSLTDPDAVTGQFSRYEIGNFDLTNPSQKNDLNRVEELYLKYNFKNSNIKLGRQFINTSFINLQDGRMSPTVVSGVFAQLNDIKLLNLQLAWLWGISPRSTISWYKPGESIGLYPVGVNPDGTKSGYLNNLNSNGIGIVQATASITKNLKIQASNLYVENIFNTSLLQTDFSQLLKNNSTIFAGIQLVKQFALKNGGNINQSNSYFQKGEHSLSFGTKFGWKNSKWETSLNYNRITSEGRFLNPREWGVEPFFTFMPRERNEGFGNVHAIVGKVNYKIPKTRVKAAFAAGYYKLPDVKNYRLNKYGLPSYSQINADVRYSFAKTMKGLEAQLLVIGKIKHGETYNNKKYEFNKVNMVQFNFVLNYNF